MCVHVSVLQDAAGVAKAMARAAVKVKCGGPVRRRQAQLASILPLVYAPFQQNSRERLSLFLLTCSMVTLRLLLWQQHLLLHQPSARYNTIFLCKFRMFLCSSSSPWIQVAAIPRQVMIGAYDQCVVMGITLSHPRSPFFCTFSGRGICICLGQGPGSNYSQGHLR